MTPLSNSRIINLIMVVGQSNVVGGSVGATSLTSRLFDRAVKFYDKSGSFPTYTSNSNGWANFATHISGFGPEYGFIRRVMETRSSENWAIVKFGSNGERIIRFFDSENDGGIWPVLQSTVDAAITDLEALGFTVNVVGCLYLQGSSDADDGGADDFADNLDTLVAQYRARWNPNMAFIVADHPAPFSTQLYRQKIRDAFNNFASSDPLACIAATTGLTSPDTVHYDSPSKEILGIRMADAALVAAII